MREILFRGKRCYNGEWTEGSLLRDTEQNEAYIAECFEDKAAYVRQVIPETVGQFVLPDKNGKEIFEGDIVKTKYGRLCIVVWFSSPAYCGWDLNPIGSAENCIGTKAPDRSDLYKSCNLEVIGNIHDNPELLNGGNENE